MVGTEVQEQGTGVKHHVVHHQNKGQRHLGRRDKERPGESREHRRVHEAGSARRFGAIAAGDTVEARWRPSADSVVCRRSGEDHAGTRSACPSLGGPGDLAE